MALDEYRRKRNFDRSPEPAGQAKPEAAAGGGLFVVQKHAARRLHYDFRLEMDGVLKSWAVTKGPSYDPKDKRLAVHVEDHPLEYGDFEGIIPKGEYGGGTVLLWDRGRWEPQGDPREGYRKGRLKFRLFGEKLKGGWALVRMAGQQGQKRENWLLVKERDEAADGEDVTAARPESVATGRDLDQIASEQDRVWRSDRGRIDPMDIPGARRAPLPDFVAPQLASLATEAPDGGEWLHEIKFDGYRALCRVEQGRARFFTRHGHDWTDKFAALAEAAGRLPVNGALIDGEVVVLDAHGASSFQMLQEALSEGRGGDMVFFAFDLLHLDGADLAAAPLEKRKEALAAVVGRDAAGPIRYSDHIDGRGPEVRARACSFALEGVVSKRRDRPYRPGRSRDWIKAKCLNRQEFVILGHTPPQGQRRGIGALLLGYWREGALAYAGKVGTGFSERSLQDLAERLAPLKRASPPLSPAPKEKDVTWAEPRLVAEVQFSNWTRDGVLRHPSFQGLRLDKEADEVVRETATIDVPLRPDLQQRLDAARITHPDRVLFARQGITKRGLAAYYLQVADWMLPHVANRMLTLVRCPQGHGKECFYQRHAGTGLPAAIRKQMVREREKSEPYLYIEDVDGLLGLVQVGTLEIHTWGSRCDDTEHPDIVVFDLDPDPDLPWQRVVEGAREVRRFLGELGLESFVKTTGGKGLHVVVPLDRSHDWEEAKALTKAVVEAIAGDNPDRYTANMAKARRQGRIFLDYLRNQRTATFVAPYSTRARPGAPVAVPIAWEELDSGLRSDHFTVETLPRRLAALKRDPWEGIFDLRQHFGEAARKRLGA